jgi:hypothetical protein
MSSSQESDSLPIDCTEHNEKLTLQELKTQIKSIETWFTDNIPEEMDTVLKLKNLITNFN